MAEPQAGVSSAPPIDPNAKAEPKAGEKNPDTGKSYSQEEVDRITEKVRKNARRDAELRVRREIQSAPAPRQEAPPREEPKKDEAPKRDDFDNYEDFIAAKAKHEGRQGAREEREKAEKESKEKEQREAQDKAARTWHDRIAKAQQELPDMEDVLEDGAAVLDEIANSPLRAIITQSEIGPKIIYELCKNPAEVARIKALPTYKQAAEIAKIEDRLTAAAQKPAGDDKNDGDEQSDAGDANRERNADGTFKTPPKKVPPKSPPEPIEPGTGRSASSNSLPSDSDDADTWRRKEVARIRKLQGK